MRQSRKASREASRIAHLQEVMETMSVLEPRPEDAPPPATQALARLKAGAVAADEARPQWFKEFSNMLRRKYAYAAGLVVLLAGLSLFSPAVRAAASDFLGLFRVQKFAAISVSPRQMAALERIAEEGLTPGEFEVVGAEPTASQVATLAEAETATGQRVLAPRVLGAADTIEVVDGAMGRLTINVQSARAILSGAGLDPTLLPESLDGQPVDVTLYPTVAQNWQAEGITLVQTDSPLIAYPPDVDATRLGEALLQFMGLPEGEAARLAASIDWTNTLLLPVPEEVATFSEVRVGGTSGLALSSLDGVRSVLLWERDGRVYVMEGSATVRELVRAANSLR